MAKATKPFNLVVHALIKMSFFLAHVAYFTSKMWNEVASIQICQYSLVHVRRVLWSSCAKVFMINKVLLSGELASMVSGFKIFWKTTEQLTKGEKNILGY